MGVNGHKALGYMVVLEMKYEHPYRPPKDPHLDKKLYQTARQVCFFTVRAYKNHTFFTGSELNLEILECLRKEKEKLDCYVHVVCLMPDHLHFLTSPKKDGVSVLDLVDQFKGKATRIAWKYGIVGKLWQPRNYDHLVRKSEDLIQIAKYILNNPVRKGLVRDHEDYPYNAQWDKFPL